MPVLYHTSFEYEQGVVRCQNEHAYERLACSVWVMFGLRCMLQDSADYCMIQTILAMPIKPYVKSHHANADDSK